MITNEKGRIHLFDDAMLNPLTGTDSYKHTHFLQEDETITGINSYYESRKGARYPETVFFGLQYIMAKHLEGQQITKKWIDRTFRINADHFGTPDYFNREMFEYILEKYDGRYPVKIRAVAEGTAVPVSNALFTVEATDKYCVSMPQMLEDYLMRTWYPSAVATKSRHIKKVIWKYLEMSCMDPAKAINFMLQDFGARGTTDDPASGIGGAGHLINFFGTDTMRGMDMLKDYYFAPDVTGYSVFATEHSTMTKNGEKGERELIEKLLKGKITYRNREVNISDKILSIVSDSYNYKRCVEQYYCQDFKHLILARTAPFVIRPDSVTDTEKTPEAVMVWTFETLWKYFGGHTNKKGYRVIADGKVKVLWGDGIDDDGIEAICKAVTEAGYSIENIACFGMGGGLLQKVNRDTQRTAIKCSAAARGEIELNESWFDVQKNPLDKSKSSKPGRLELVRHISDGAWETIKREQFDAKLHKMMFHDVFENGHILKAWDINDLRANAQIEYTYTSAAELV